MRERLAAALFLALGLSVHGGDDPATPSPTEEPEPPSALLMIPFVLERGETTRCLVRGQHLEPVEKIEAAPGVSVEIVSRGEAKLPNGWKPEQLGDQQLLCDVTVDTAFCPGTSSIVLTLQTASGDSGATIDAALAGAGGLVDEKEPNPGFHASQPIALDHSLRGVIGADKDVDVFHFEAEAGTDIRACVMARRHGSALDPLLILYDAEGFERARGDDTDRDRDAALNFTVPVAGRYFLVLMDAHDTGSEAHVYQLSLGSGGSRANSGDTPSR